MGSTQICQGQGTNHIDADGLLMHGGRNQPVAASDWRPVTRGGKCMSVAWKDSSYMVSGHFKCNYMILIIIILEVQTHQEVFSFFAHMPTGLQFPTGQTDSWRCVSHQSTFGRPVSPAAFILGCSRLNWVKKGSGLQPP